MAMTKKESLFLTNKLNSYYKETNVPILALEITGSNMFDQKQNLYECSTVEESNVEDVFKAILKNRLNDPELFYYIFEDITFGNIYNLINFLTTIIKEELLPKDTNKIVHFINITNKELIVKATFKPQYELFKQLQQIVNTEQMKQLNELFVNVLEKISKSDIKEEISYKFKIQEFLFNEKSDILNLNNHYYSIINKMVLPIKKVLKIEVRNVHGFTIGTPQNDIELIFIGEDINKYKSFVEYLVTNLHSYLAERNSKSDRTIEAEEKDIEMFLLKFELEYKIKDKNSINIESKSKM